MQPYVTSVSSFSCHWWKFFGTFYSDQTSPCRGNLPEEKWYCFSAFPFYMHHPNRVWDLFCFITDFPGLIPIFFFLLQHFYRSWPCYF